MYSYTVEIQIDTDAVSAEEASDKVRLAIAAVDPQGHLDYRITAVFDEDGERADEPESEAARLDRGL